MCGFQLHYRRNRLCYSLNEKEISWLYSLAIYFSSPMRYFNSRPRRQMMSCQFLSFLLRDWREVWKKRFDKSLSNSLLILPVCCFNCCSPSETSANISVMSASCLHQWRQDIWIVWAQHSRILGLHWKKKKPIWKFDLLFPISNNLSV